MYNQEYEVKNTKYDKIHEQMHKYKYDKALTLLEDFMVEYPNDKYARYDYAICLMRLKRHEESIQVLEILRKKKPKKILYRVYALLIDVYNISRQKDKIKEVLDNLDKDLTDFERDLLKIKGYYNLGLGNEASKVIKKIKPIKEKEKSELNILVYQFANNLYYKQHQKEIEENIKDYLKKHYISDGQARNMYLKLYLACDNYEEAYKYIIIKEESSLDVLFNSYEICKKLNKKDECQKCLDIMNRTAKLKAPYDIAVINAKLLYLNGRIEEAYEICKELSTDNLDAAMLVYTYGIKLDKIDESIDIIKNVIETKAICNKKMENLLRVLIDLYIHAEKYKEAYDLYIENLQYINTSDRKTLDLLLSKKLDFESKYINNSRNYIQKQIENYDYENAVQHIAKHKYEKKEKLVHTVFSENIRIEDLIEMIKPYLTKENLCKVGIYDKYEIDCENLDINENVLTVGTLSKTNDVIFCFPSKKMEDEIDLDLDETKEEKVIAPKTGLERFNQKYKKFVMNK